VFQVATKEWKGVSSDGVTAAYVAEAAEATDASPTLAQPVITTQQGRAFIPFSIELGQDWSGLQTELLTLIRDGRDVLDATKFLSGTGTNEPVGLLAVGSTGSLTTTRRIQTDGAATLDVDDVWDLKGNVASTRFAANSTFAGHPGMFDRIYRFTPAGSTTEPQAMPTRDGPLCGRPKIEWSTMVNTTTTGSKVLLLGDFSNYFIADRIGMTAEIIPHLFGATNRFPPVSAASTPTGAPVPSSRSPTPSGISRCSRWPARRCDGPWSPSRRRSTVPSSSCTEGRPSPPTIQWSRGVRSCSLPRSRWRRPPRPLGSGSGGEKPGGCQYRAAPRRGAFLPSECAVRPGH
jgi:hypothetical protein